MNPSYDDAHNLLLGILKNFGIYSSSDIPRLFDALGLEDGWQGAIDEKEALQRFCAALLYMDIFSRRGTDFDALLRATRRLAEIDGVALAHAAVAKSMPDDIRQKLTAFFAGDEAKVATWWDANNPLLGGVSPQAMLAMGREAKLRQWIDAQLIEGAAGQDLHLVFKRPDG